MGLFLHTGRYRDQGWAACLEGKEERKKERQKEKIEKKEKRSEQIQTCNEPDPLADKGVEVR